MQNSKLNECFSEGELIEFFKANHDNLNIITNYTTGVTTIFPLSLTFKCSLNFEQLSLQIERCGYLDFNKSVCNYKRTGWRGDSYFERVLTPSFVKAFTLLMIYRDAIPAPNDFSSFYIKCCCTEIESQMFELQKWCDKDLPERRNVVLPEKTPFSRLDIMTRINNMYCGFLREVAAGLKLADMCRELANDANFTNCKIDVIHDLNADMFGDSDLIINISDKNSSATKMVSLAFYDNTERGVEKRNSKLKQKRKETQDYDLKIAIPTCLARFHVSTPNTYSISGVELYTEKTMRHILCSALDKRIMGDYILSPLGRLMTLNAENLKIFE